MSHPRKGQAAQAAANRCYPELTEIQALQQWKRDVAITQLLKSLYRVQPIWKTMPPSLALRQISAVNALLTKYQSKKKGPRK